MNPSIAEIKKDLKKLTKKQLIERVMIWINRSSNLAINLNRLEKELQDFESKVSRLESLNISYKELAGRKSGENLSIEEMAENLYEYLVEKINININVFSEKWDIKIINPIHYSTWENSNDDVKDFSRAGITRILTLQK